MQSNTLARSGRSTLARHTMQPRTKLPVEVKSKQVDKAALASFQATSKLSAALLQERQKSKNSQVLVDGAKELLKEVRLVKELQKSMPKKSPDAQFQAQIAALNQYKPPPPKQQTRSLVQRIIMDRRQKHLNSLQQFQADMQQYMNSVKDISASTKSQAQEFIKINDEDLQEAIKKLSDDKLLGENKQILEQIDRNIQANRTKRDQKIQSLKNNLLLSDQDRSGMIEHHCNILQQRLKDNAFVLQQQAANLANQWLVKLKTKQTEQTTSNEKFVADLDDSQKKNFQQLKAALVGKQQRWKQLKHEQALKQFQTTCSTPQYNNPSTRKSLYQQIKQLQNKTHKDRSELIDQLIALPNYTKTTVDQWINNVKTKSDQFNSQLNKFVSDLVKEGENAKAKGERLREMLKNTLNYIGYLQPEENEKVISEKAQPILDKNVQQAKNLLSKVINYIQKYDSKQNQLCQGLGKFVLKLGTKNDEYRKSIQLSNQTLQLNKAKILDDDQQKNDKLNQQLDNLKKQLKQSLHHIRLQQLSNKCFTKIDQIQSHYRNTHQLNKKLIAQQPAVIQGIINKIQSQTAEIFQLFDPSRKTELTEKNKKQAEDKALKKIQQEEKKKIQEQIKQSQQTKKKTGKAPPPPKPKDPKKAASQLEQRKQAILKQIGIQQLKQFKSSTGKLWLISQTIQQITANLYKFQENLQPPAVDTEQIPKPIDYVQPIIKDCEGIAVVSDNVMFKKQHLANKLTQLRQKVFTGVMELKTQLLNKFSDQSKEFLDQSLDILDDRLKQHYSLKGKLQSEVFVKRSAQITHHKKKYQRFARDTRERMDGQTQKFNFLLEKSLQLMKDHNQGQKKIRQQLVTAKNMSQLQGLAARNRQNTQRFEANIKEIVNELQRLSTIQVQTLVDKNEQFLKQCKDMSAGGQYSAEELLWYKTMMTEITTQLQQQKTRRSQKMKEIEQHTSKKRQQLVESFEKDYNFYIQQLAAKDCSGKKYGKPKRLAQERTRMQMSKCEQAQQNLNQMFIDCQKQLEIPRPSTLQIRKKLMTIRTCIQRYSKHIQALKPDAKVQDMPRVNYNQSRCSTALLSTEQQQDDKRKQAELQKLGPLSQQKDDRKFNLLIDDIQKLMKQEVLKVYIGEKAKYLGADKVPEALKEYIANMKKNAENFRLGCVRQLRQLCLQLTALSERITSVIFKGLYGQWSQQRIESTKPNHTAFFELQKKMQKVKAENLRKLRPNLINPACRQQLDELDIAEKKRISEYRQSIKQTLKSLLDGQFKAGTGFLTSVLNNFQFLLQYYDALLLEQDFIKLPGDQSKQKKHLNLKQLMLLKQKGTTFDANSERNITKKWEGINYSMFDCPDRKYQYVKTAPQQPKVDTKKGAKKQAKDAKKEQPPTTEQNLGKTKDIQSIKTDRQKSCFEWRNKVLDEFKKQFEKQVELYLKDVGNAQHLQQAFEAKWNTTVDEFRKAK